MNKEHLSKILKILNECSWKKTAKFNYTNSKGTKSTKQVEVYNIDEQKLSFFAYDLSDDSPKTFKIESIKNYIEICEEFVPRYEKK